MKSAGHDLTIALDGKALAGKPQLFEQLRNAGGFGQLSGCSVDSELDHRLSHDRSENSNMGLSFDLFAMQF